MQWMTSRRLLAMAAALVLLASATLASGSLGAAGASAQGVVPNNSVRGPLPVCPALAGVDDKCEAWSAYWDNVDGHLTFVTEGSPADIMSSWDTPLGGIAVSPGGERIYQAGVSHNNRRCATDATMPCKDVATVARDADGNQLWEAMYQGANGDSNYAKDIQVSADGTVVYLLVIQDRFWSEFGGDGPKGSDDKVGVVAYDAATGNELWALRYGLGPGDGAKSHSMAVSPDGDEIYVTAFVRRKVTSDEFASGTWNSGDVLTLGFDAHDGRYLWSATYDSPMQTVGLDWDLPAGLAVSPDGTRVYVTAASPGVKDGTGGTDPVSSSDEVDMQDYATIAYNAVPPTESGDPELGTELWVARFDNVGLHDSPIGGVAVSPDGGLVFVTGVSAAGTTEDGVHTRFVWETIAYDAATGQQVWRQEHSEEGAGYFSSARALTVSPDGTRLYVTGSVDGENVKTNAFGTFVGSPTRSSKLDVVAYDVLTGTELMAAQYPGIGVSNAYGVQVSPDGETVFIAGDVLSAKAPSTASSLVTVAFDASTGMQRWAARVERADMTSNAICQGSQGECYTLSGTSNKHVQLSGDGRRLYVSGSYWGPLLVNTGDMLLLAYDTQAPGSGTPTADSLVGEPAAALPASSVG